MIRLTGLICAGSHNVVAWITDGQNHGGRNLGICEKCGGESPFMEMIGDVGLCAGCASRYDELLMMCQSRKKYDDLVRQVRAEVRGPKSASVHLIE